MAKSFVTELGAGVFRRTRAVDLGRTRVGQLGQPRLITDASHWVTLVKVPQVCGRRPHPVASNAGLEAQRFRPPTSE